MTIIQFIYTLATSYIFNPSLHHQIHPEKGKTTYICPRQQGHVPLTYTHMCVYTHTHTCLHTCNGYMHAHKWLDTDGDIDWESLFRKLASKLKLIFLTFNHVFKENINIYIKRKYKHKYKHTYKDKEYLWRSLSVSPHNSMTNSHNQHLE